ncbi:hypothetical protein H0H92_012576 [Tricholoma furcatifolium]|nr:hypothetical protein H0H92_012576 [Tricholoma furcatifolium]
MSLSTLLRGSEAIDSELDALFTTRPSHPFKQPATLIPIPGSSKDSAKKKRKSVDDSNADRSISEPKKRVKTSPKADSSQNKTSKEKKVELEEKRPKDRKGTKGKVKAKEVEPDDEDENSDLENAYLAGKTTLDEKAGATDGSDKEGNAEGRIEHESVTKAKKAARSAKPKTKYVPEGETPELRDRRTIFIGNLSVEVAQQRPLLKQLQRHILSHIPTAKIESTRFRSVPFQAPTSEIPDADALEGKANPKITQTKGKPKTARPHDIDRTSSWRSKEKEKDQENTGDEKKYLTPNQKKKVAFINQEFHSTADTIHAYVVFAHPVPPENRPKNLPPLPPVLDPYDAAKQAVKTCDGSTFMDRVIRVDLVGKKGLPSVGEDGEADLDVGAADPKSTVFVGNLDFASKEEDLRAFFEGVVSAERGPPPVDAEGEGNTGASKKANSSWVVHVRIVRDKDTQLGKGFAYVQFTDYECVDELLALEPEKFKFAKRKLRVQRCRTLPGASSSTRQATASKKTKDTPNAAAAKRPPPVVVPKGDPSLGEKLAHLNKEARKQFKSADADRVARRLAKKKARMAMGVSGVKVQGKDRERVRKNTGVKSSGKKAGAGAKKGRVRSERSLAKRNGKKSGASSEG